MNKQLNEWAKNLPVVVAFPHNEQRRGGCGSLQKKYQ